MVTPPITCAPGATHAECAMDGDDSTCMATTVNLTYRYHWPYAATSWCAYTVTMVRMSPVAVLADSVSARTGMDISDIIAINYIAISLRPRLLQLLSDRQSVDP